MTGHQQEGSAASGATGLCTDLYELRMVESYLKRGMTSPATFSLFIRPAQARPWYVALGVHRVLELLESFRYGPEELEYLRTQGFADDTLAWLEAFEPSGEVWAVPEGTVVLAGEPILEVTGPMPVAQVLETAVLNLVQYPTAIATKAARCKLVAGDRPLADFGLRRAHGLETGMEAALAAWIGGGFATSNVEAGRRYGIPVTGTMAHSYVQAYVDETDAFRDFAADHPEHTVLLVDTYDTLQGVRHAATVADELKATGGRVRGVRLDSGDLGELATEARKLLDEAGHDDTQIFASGGLDEYRIHDLLSSGAPIDAFGVGSALTVAMDHPALDIVYKLVDYDGRSVAKFSGAKSTLPGEKQVFRSDGAGPESDVLSTRHAAEPGHRLLKPVWRDGVSLLPFDVAESRQRVADELDRLPAAWRRPRQFDEPPMPAIGPELQGVIDEVRKSAFG